ncbi:MAG: methyltransferase [Pseudomonadota bacterium]
MADRKKAKTLTRFRGIVMPTASHPAIRKVRRKGIEPSIHGNKLWKSSCLLIDYMKRNPPVHTRRVLDVGCGWGIAGIWCANQWDAAVTSSDADPDVFPYLDAVAELNGVSTESLVSRFQQLKKKRLSEYDMLIAADVCFWDELVNPVYNLVNRAVQAGVKHILIADPERSTFLEMAERSIDRHGGELIDWEVKGKLKARGAILSIENY